MLEKLVEIIMCDGDDMIGFDGYGTLQGKHIISKIVTQVQSYITYPYKDEIHQLDVSLDDEIEGSCNFYLYAIDYDKMEYYWKYIDPSADCDDIHVGKFVDIRLVTDSEPSQKDEYLLNKMKSNLLDSLAKNLGIDVTDKVQKLREFERSVQNNNMFC